MEILQRKLIHNGELKLWEIKGNTGDYLNININVDTPIHKIAHINIWVSGGFDITRTAGNPPDVPKVERIAPYCSLSKELPFDVVNKGGLTFTANQDNSVWYCINHSQYKLLTGESFNLKAGESTSIPANSYIFVAIGDLDGLPQLSLELFESERTITAIVDCMIVRINNV